jgi:hypothetical protein
MPSKYWQDRPIRKEEQASQIERPLNGQVGRTGERSGLTAWVGSDHTVDFGDRPDGI